MKIRDLVANTNRITGHGNYTYSTLVGYFDEIIDTINVDLNVYLPPVSDIYENTFDKTEAELLLDYYAPDDEGGDALDNQYIRIPDSFLRNYIAYEAAYRVLRDEDEEDEVLRPKKTHADDWYRRLIAVFNDYTIEDTEAISIGGDADEVGGVTVDDTGMGFYNPLDPIDNQ